MELDNGYSQPENRLLDKISMHVEEEALHAAEHPGYTKNSPKSLERRVELLAGLLKGVGRKKDLTSEEKFAKLYVRHELKKARLRQRPAFWRVLWNINPLRVAYNQLSRRQRYYNGINRSMDAFREKTGNARNAYNLQQTLQDLGFKNQLERPLVKRMEIGGDTFTIRDPEISKDDTDFLLYFKKAPGSNTYYFAGFEATPKPPGTARFTGKNEPPTLYFEHKENIKYTAEEAQRLVHDLFVLKKMDGQNTLIGIAQNGKQLEFYLFDLEKKLDQLPIAEWNVPETREKMIKDLVEERNVFIKLKLPSGEEKGAVVSLTKDPATRGIKLNFRDLEGPIDPYDLVKDRSNAQEILQKINQQPAKDLKKPVLSVVK